MGKKKKKKTAKKAKVGLASWKYLDALGVHPDDVCVFNTTAVDESRQERFEKQRIEMGFDERETWSMDYTIATWLYSHFTWYAKNSIVDTTFHRVDVPVFDGKLGCTDLTVTKRVTHKKAIKIVRENLAEFIERYDSSEPPFEKLTYALHVTAAVMPYMWW